MPHATSDPAHLSPADRRPTIFYGWWIALAGMLVTFVGSGIGFYCLGVFLDPLVKTHGWSKSEVSYGITLFFVAAGLFGIPLGRAMDARGPRPILIFGAIDMAVCLALVGQVRSLWQLYAVFALMAAGYSALSTLTVGAVITRWFVRRRASALSLALTGTSLGGVIWVPLTEAMISGRGIGFATAVLGLVVLVIAIPCAVFVIRHDPAEMHLRPDGDRLPPAAIGGHREPELGLTQHVWTHAEALRTLSFWALTVAFAVVLLGQTAYLVHQLSFLGGVIGKRQAAIAVSTTAGASIAGRFAMGAIADRFDKRRLAILCVLLETAALLLVARSSSAWLLFLGTALIGLTIGNIYMFQSLLIGECFGPSSFGTVYGMVAVLSMIGSAAGPTIAGALFDATGSYRLSFLLLSLGGFVGAALIAVARPAKPPRAALAAPQFVSAGDRHS